MAGRFELLYVRWQVEPKNLGLFCEGKKDVFFLKKNKFLDISCMSLTFTDHLVFVYVQEKDLA